MNVKNLGVYLVLVFGVHGIQSSICWGLESFDQLRARTRSSEAFLYDRHGQLIHELRKDSQVRQLEWTPIEQISDVLQYSVILSEDRRFWEHSGVDWKAVVHAAWVNAFNRHPRGASTISMQLVSFLDQAVVPKRLRRGMVQKIRQMRLAGELERKWTKNQILEAYLNGVTFRGEFRGISAASYGLFSKAPHGLNQAESLILAALIRSPSAEGVDVKRRACQLGKNVDTQFNCASLASYFEGTPLDPDVLRKHQIQPRKALAFHVATRVLKDAEARGKMKASVTLDRDLQIFVMDSLRRQVLNLQSKNVSDAAALVVENRTGHVLAYVGGVGNLSSASYVDGVQAARQVGSTLKPFLYGLALDRRYLTPASLLEDTPLDVPVSGSVYRPQNYDHEFHGNRITLRTALASSLNIPAVKTLNLMGVESFVETLERLGFKGLKDPDYYGPSLALGSADLSLWDLVNAYRTLSNRGIWGPLQLELPSENPIPIKKIIFSPGAAFLISDILSDRESRGLTFGLESELALPFWAAVKTGTSKDMRDNWCLGYSDRYTVGVWVGNFSGAPMWSVSGVSGAAPAWSEIMRRLHRSKMTNNHKTSVYGQASIPGSIIRAKDEWFIRGTEPSEDYISQALSRSQARARITYPVEGTVLVRDPDIPSSVQRVLFRTNISDPQFQWILEGVENGAENKAEKGTETSRLTGESVTWQPKRGVYMLTLSDSEGVVMDSVHFKVR